MRQTTLIGCLPSQHASVKSARVRACLRSFLRECVCSVIMCAFMCVCMCAVCVCAYACACARARACACADKPSSTTMVFRNRETMVNYHDVSKQGNHGKLP